MNRPASGFTIARAQERDIADVTRLFKAYEAHIGVDLGYQDFATELATLPGKCVLPEGSYSSRATGTVRPSDA